MKRYVCFTLCFLILLPALASALTTDEVDWQVDDYFKNSYTVGGALVLFHDGNIVYERYFGTQNKAQEVPVTADTYFRIASVTKMVSGIGLLQLMEQGVVDLDQDISEYFGYAIANTYHRGTPITLRQLMSHTSSLRAELPGLTRTIADTLARDQRKHAYYTESTPGETYLYSNFGAGVSGAILEAVTGMSVNSYMQKNVFEPLSIDAAYAPCLLGDPDDISNLYRSDRTCYRRASTLLQELYEDFADPETHFRTTIGSLWIRAKDLAKIGMALCGNGTVDGVTILSEDTVALMRADQASLGASVTGESPYGLFLQREKTLLADKIIYGHQGLLEGILCNVYFDPETQFGFVLLTNGCKNTMDNHVGVLSRRLFDYTYDSFVNHEVTDPFLVP